MAWMRDSTCREAFREKTGGASLRRSGVEPASEPHVKLCFVKKMIWQRDQLPGLYSMIRNMA